MRAVGSNEQPRAQPSIRRGPHLDGLRANTDSIHTHAFMDNRSRAPGMRQQRGIEPQTGDQQPRTLWECRSEAASILRVHRET
jgi:hypothetical protein